jgi:ribosomal protein S18 acetylase RimI-like enzyme
MATISETISNTKSSTSLRAFDARRDLNAVADLIELGFADTLDDDGRRYLRQMRSTAMSMNHGGWLGVGGWLAGYTMTGYVWEEEGRVVGNATVIPYVSGTKRLFLIANVVVHPDHRQKGIGKALTVKAIEHAQRAAAPAVWLHVRRENSVAIRLYESLGFIERACRVTWHSSGGNPAQPFANHLQIVRPRHKHWTDQQHWLQRNYPKELLWNLKLPNHALRPGIAGALTRFFNNVEIDQWAIQRQDKLAAVVSWQAMPGQGNILWLAAPQEADELAIQELLQHARKNLPARRLLTMDYPADRCTAAIEAAGFQAHQILIWMEKALK